MLGTVLRGPYSREGLNNTGISSKVSPGRTEVLLKSSSVDNFHATLRMGNSGRYRRPALFFFL